MARIKPTRKIKLDLTKFFKREAVRNIIGKPNSPFPTYKSLMQTKRGVSLDKAPVNILTTRKRKGKSHWMVHTGELMKKGFLYNASKMSLTIYANPSNHSGNTYYMTRRGKKPYKQKNPPTYEQLFGWHNKKGYSGVFEKLPVGSKFPERLVKEVGKQLYPQIRKGIPDVIHRNWKI